MSDYELQLKVKNARMLERMRAHNITSGNYLAKLSETPASQVYAMLNLKTTCYGHSGSVRPFVLRVAAVLDCLPEDLFPEAHLFTALPRNEFSAVLDRDTLCRLSYGQTESSPEMLIEHMADQSDRDVFEDILSAGEISAREASVLRSRFKSEKTCAEIAEEKDLSVARIQQIEQKAIRKMRNPRKREALEVAGGALMEGSWYDPQEAIRLMREADRNRQEIYLKEKRRLAAAVSKNVHRINERTHDKTIVLPRYFQYEALELYALWDREVQRERREHEELVRQRQIELARLRAEERRRMEEAQFRLKVATDNYDLGRLLKVLPDAYGLGDTLKQKVEAGEFPPPDYVKPVPDSKMVIPYWRPETVDPIIEKLNKPKP